jgi:hypothetical protein
VVPLDEDPVDDDAPVVDEDPVDEPPAADGALLLPRSQAATDTTEATATSERSARFMMDVDITATRAPAIAAGRGHVLAPLLLDGFA